MKKAKPNTSIKESSKKYTKGVILSVLFPIKPKLLFYLFLPVYIRVKAVVPNINRATISKPITLPLL